MRTFNAEAATAVIELEQMLADLNREIDVNAGADAWRYYAEDCTVELGTSAFKGHAGVRKYYADRLDAILRQAKDGRRTTRHLCENIRVVIEGADRATVTCLIVTFAGDGQPPLMTSTAPIAISDARYECQRAADGQWQIDGHHGSPVFLGEDRFAKMSIEKR